MDSQVQTKIPAWIDGGYVSATAKLIMCLLKAFSYFVMVFLQGTRSALALQDVATDSETFLQNLNALLTWVSEIEELTANQKAPSSEVKVVKAQLQEQKVCFSNTSFLPLFKN